MNVLRTTWGIRRVPPLLTHDDRVSILRVTTAYISAVTTPYISETTTRVTTIGVTQLTPLHIYAVEEGHVDTAM